MSLHCSVCYLNTVNGNVFISVFIYWWQRIGLLKWLMITKCFCSLFLSINSFNHINTWVFIIKTQVGHNLCPLRISLMLTHNYCISGTKIIHACLTFLRIHFKGVIQLSFWYDDIYTTLYVDIILEKFHDHIFVTYFIVIIDNLYVLHFSDYEC